MNRITYKDCIKQAAINLQLDDVIAALDSTELPTADVLSEIERLADCAKMTAIEIASDYIPLTREEEAASENRRIRISSLEERVSAIVSVRQGVHNVCFKLEQQIIFSN
ncbi:MAG: hypothetical protein FWE22_00145 [Firmicutes bacterium]|nr:hypothetical protein [Bacillota bacterium]